MVIKNFLQKLANSMGYRVIRYNDPILSTDSGFMRIYRRCKDFTMTSMEAMHSLHKAVKYVVDNHIDGDFVECGTWRGGSLMVVGLSLIENSDTTRRIYAYDTFEGMSRPTENDLGS